MYKIVYLKEQVTKNSIGKEKTDECDKFEKVD